MRPRLAVSMGDPAGVGVEVLLRAAASGRIRRACRLTVFGDRGIIGEIKTDLHSLVGGEFE